MKAGWGKRLEQARLRVGKDNKTTFPDLVGSNRVSWAKFEDELVPPNFEIMMKVSAATGVSLDWIATGRETPIAPLDRDKLVAAIRGAMQIVDSARKSGKREYTPEEIGEFVADIYASMIKTPIDENKPSVQSLGVAANEEAPNVGHRKTRS